MNRKDVDELLNDFNGELKRNVDSLDEFYQEFLLWNSAVQESIKLNRSGRKNVHIVPPTPCATLRCRRKLSTIGEGSGREGEGELRGSRISKDTGRAKSPPKHLKRTRLSYDEDDDVEIQNNSVGTSVTDSQNICPVNVQGLSLQSEQENDICEVSEEKRAGRKLRRTKQSSILGRKHALPAKRNTRSNARITRSITCELLNECDTDFQNALTSLSNPTQENVNEESACQRGRRSKQSSIVGKEPRVTSTRISKSNARINTKSVNHEPVNSERNSQKFVSDNCNIRIVLEDIGIQEKRASNISSEERSRTTRNSSFEIANNISQDSLNVPHVISHSFISRSSVRNSHKIKEATTTIIANENDTNTVNSNSEALNDISQDSLNTSNVAEIPVVVGVQDNSNTDHSKRLSSNTESNKSITSHNKSINVKELSIRLTRIDGIWNQTLPLMRSEAFQKVVAVQSGSRRRKSEGAEKTSFNVATTSESLKRSNSFLDNRMSKKGRYDTNVKEIEVEHASENVHGTNNKPEDTGRRKSGRLTRSKLSETNKNHQEFVEIQSFSEISILPSVVESNNVLEELSEEHDKLECNDKTDSGKGNLDTGLEHSEYYSLVDACEITLDGKDVPPAPKKKSVNNTKVVPKPSLIKKREETLHVIREQSTPTPERPISRKGGKSPALFSAYANEPVKNRVAAYEGLSTVTEEMQVPATNKRVTRTKTRAMAAAAAAAAVAASTAGAIQTKTQSNNRKSGPSVKVTRASWRLKKKIANLAKKNDASKENSFQLNSSKNTDRYYKNISGTGGKILADVNGLFSPALNNLKKTPMTGPRTIHVNNLSSGQMSKSGYRPGILPVETFIKKPVIKTVQESEIKKIEEQKKREEKEREAIRRREEFLKNQAEEKKKKRDEIRLRVQEKREAQEKEKQESQLRVGKEKDEKWHILQQEREAKLKGKTLKKKLESERKAAEARRKLEEAEHARIAKLKMEELQHKKEQEEAEKERLRRIAEEKETTLLRERLEQNTKVLAAVAKAKAENQKNTVLKPPGKVKAVDTTFTKPLDSTFTVQSTSKSSHNLDNAYNLEEIESGDSDDEDSLPKHTARWAIKSALLLSSANELRVCRRTRKFFGALEINISSIFPRKAFKRTSSAIWTTPPRYSVLPKY